MQSWNYTPRRVLIGGKRKNVVGSLVSLISFRTSQQRRRGNKRSNAMQAKPAKKSPAAHTQFYATTNQTVVLLQSSLPCTGLFFWFQKGTRISVFAFISSLHFILRHNSSNSCTRKYKSKSICRCSSVLCLRFLCVVLDTRTHSNNRSCIILPRVFLLPFDVVAYTSYDMHTIRPWQ